MQYIKAPHGAETGNHVANGIVAYVAHMQIAGGIREHRVNAADLTLLKRAVSGKQAAGSGYHWNNGDLDHDRRLTREDIDRMQYFLLRKPETA